MSFNAKCLRQTANWSKLDKAHKFDKNSFDPQTIENDIQERGPKLQKLLDNINYIDSEDMKKNGRKYKHFIFSSVKFNAGAKIVAAGLLSQGYKLAIDKKHNLLSDSSLLKNEGNNFLIITSTPLFNLPVMVKNKKKILDKFNNRPDNVYGNLARIIILDSGYKEGIDLFDCKYVHIFEPQTSQADTKQSIGRALRLCGHRGLDFHPQFGWSVNVYIYDVSIPDEYREKFKNETLFKLFMDNSGIDLKKLKFIDTLEKLTILGSVDNELTQNVHSFKFITQDMQNLNKIIGGKSIGTQVICSGKCGLRPTKDVPIPLKLFITVFYGQDRKFNKKKMNNLRSFFCNLLKSDNQFCEGIKQSFINPELYVKKNADQLKKSILLKRHMSLKYNNRKNFIQFIKNYITIDVFQNNNIIDPILNMPSNKNNKNSNIIDPIINIQSNKNNKNNIIDLKHDINSIETVPVPINKLTFDEMRKFIRENYFQFKWPDVKIENLCDNKLPLENDNNKLVTFSPTQNFNRHFFTPKTYYKGLLTFHSLGSGKSCNAIATASSTFALEDWTILWVTRTTLKSDIYKNQFEKICNLEIRKKIRNGINMPDNLHDKLKLLSKPWKILPMSYKQFTNLVSGKNQFYDKLININGKQDPLKKTLLIIDEAHKLYGTSDLLGNEKPNMVQLKKSIQNSYDVSGDLSVKLLLMTGTPITNDPMELIKLINLMKQSNEQMPDNFDEFKKTYLNDDDNFNEASTIKYLNDITGYVSYLNRERDARQFAQPTITFINSALSKSIIPITEIEKIVKAIDDENDLEQRKILRYHLREKKKELKNDFSQEAIIYNKCKKN